MPEEKDKETLTKRIQLHFDNEMVLLEDIAEAGLTESERGELVALMLQHPHVQKNVWKLLQPNALQPIMERLEAIQVKQEVENG